MGGASDNGPGLQDGCPFTENIHQGSLVPEGWLPPTCLDPGPLLFGFCLLYLTTGSWHLWLLLPMFQSMSVSWSSLCSMICLLLASPCSQADRTRGTLSSASVILLLIPSREFLISFLVLFIIVCLLFSSSRSLLSVSCIFSILFPRFWIIFTIITLNSFSGRLPISSSFVRSGGFLPCTLMCCVFLCFLILLNLLCLGFPFCRLQVCISHYFWCLSPVVKVV